MITVKYYLHNKESKLGFRPLYMDVHLDGVGRLQQAVGESMAAKHWNHAKQIVNAKHENHRAINARLERLALKVQQQFREMMDGKILPTGEDLRLILRPLRAQKLMNTGQASNVRDIYEAWKTSYLQKKNRGIKTEGLPEKDLQGYNYARSYSQVVQALEDFKPNLKPKDLTQSLWDEYVGYLYEEAEVADSTVGTHIKGWKLFRGQAGLSVDDTWLKNTYGRSGVQPDLSWKEVLQLKNFSYGNEAHRAAAHIFVINCFLGLRFQDLSNLQPIHFQPIETPTYGTITAIQRRQGKTGGLILVPLPPIAQELLDGYGGVLPFHLLTRSGAKGSVMTIFNETIKVAAKEAKLKRLVRTERIVNKVVQEKEQPLHGVISSHIARHTAGSRIQEADSYELAQLVLGHAKQGSTATYAHRDTVKTAERILKAWEYYNLP